jgi:hypothetical protein
VKKKGGYWSGNHSLRQYRLPAIYYFRYFASDGGLISYGPDEMDPEDGVARQTKA